MGAQRPCSLVRWSGLPLLGWVAGWREMTAGCGSVAGGLVLDQPLHLLQDRVVAVLCLHTPCDPSLAGCAVPHCGRAFPSCGLVACLIGQEPTA